MRRNSEIVPFADSGRRAMAAILLCFVVYTAGTLLLSAHTAARANHRAAILEIAGRQRTLAERYTKEVLLAEVTGTSADDEIATVLRASAAALLDGGTAPATPGDDDGARVPGVTDRTTRRQLVEEQRLIEDLIAAGRSATGEGPAGQKLQARERFPKTMTRVERLRALTGLTSNVSLNVTRSIGELNDRSVGRLLIVQRIAGGVGLVVFALLGWALVASTRRRTAHFRSLVQSTTDLVFVFRGAQARYVSTSVSHFVERDARDLLGEGIWDAVHPADRDALRAVVGQPDRRVVEFRLAQGVGRWRDLEANVTDLREDRDVRGVVLNARDVTERKRADAAREDLLVQEKQANERLRDLDRLKDEFVALVSHELRTPLTSIIGYVELLRDDGLTDEQMLYTDVVDRNAERLLHVVSDLLFIAQIENGKLTVERDVVDVSTVLHDSVTAASPRAAAAGLDLQADVAVGLLAIGDAVRLAQVVDNLISNAIKFTAPGGSVRVDATTAAGSIAIDVRDSGIGINADDVDRLFNKFFRAKTATDAAIQGTGLGLAISKAIAIAHGGSIHVTSEEGVGTTFQVTIPSLHEPAALTPEAARSNDSRLR